MKRFSSILLAALVATLMLVSNVRAQQYTGVPAISDWQNALLTWNTPTFPGQNNDNTIAIVAAAGTLNNAGGIANRVRALQVNAGVLTLNGTGTLVIGALNLNAAAGGLIIGPGLNVVIDSIIDGAATSVITVQAGGKLTLRRGTNAPTQQVLLGGTVMAAGSLNGEVIIENGFNGGNFPTNLFYIAPPAAATAMVCLNAITINAPMNVGENVTTPALGGILTVNGGTLQVEPGAAFQVNQTGANSLQGTGTLNAAVGGSVVLGANFNAGVLPGQRLRNPFTGTLTMTTAMTLNSDATFSPLNPATTQESILNLNAAAAILTVPAGVTLNLNANINNAVQGAGFIAINAGGTVNLGNGFNAGVIPSARFTTINGTLRTIGASSLNVAGAPAGGMFSSSGQFEIGGDLTLAGAGTLEFSQTGPNSVRAVNNARIISPGRNTTVTFNANANNGVLPGCLFANPFSGGFIIRGSMSLSCDLFMATDAGPITFNNNTIIAPAAPPSIILTIQPGVTLALRQNIAGNVTARSVTAPGTAVIDPLTSYIQGANNTSNLILGLGANGGTVPTAPAIGMAPNTPFLPLSGDNTYNGKLTLEGSLTFATNLAMGVGSILDLAGGNLTVQDTRVLRLLNSGSNSLIGTGVIQAVAPAAFTQVNGANFYAHVEPPVANTRGSMVEIGASMNGAIFPAARFANPFQGNINFSTAGSITVQGDFVHSIPQGRGYFVVGAITSTANITIGANSSVRLNGINPSSLYGSAVAIPPVPVFPGGSFQGVDATSRLVIGVGHANESNTQAVTTTGTFLVNPFNGTLAFAGNAIIYTSATIGINGGLELGGSVRVTSGTLFGATGTIANSGHNRMHPMLSPGGTIPYVTNITITLNNQAPNSISGLGTFLTATGNTLIFGAGANGGIIPGNRLASPHAGTIATVGAMTLSGNLTMGDLRDGYIQNAGGTLYHSSSFLKLGSVLTIDNGAVLTVSNATAQPFSTAFTGDSRAFILTTTGTGRIQANPNGELRILDGFNSRHIGSNSAFNYPAGFANLAIAPTLRNQVALYIPTQSFFHPGYLASPFNGKLFFGSDMPNFSEPVLAARSFTGGFSRFNITTGTLTIGTTGFLGLVSPLYVSAATAGLLPVASTDGYPRLILNQTGSNSLVGTTTGSYIQSSTGQLRIANGQFFMGSPHLTAGGVTGNGVTGGTVVLGPGFNAGIIPGALFGEPVSGSAGGGPSRTFSGRLKMPNTGSLTLTGILTMNSPIADNANFGILDLGEGGTGAPGSSPFVLNVQDGSTLVMGTTGSIVGAIVPGSRGSGIVANGTAALNNPAATVAPQGQGFQSARALQGQGTIQGLGNNARVVLPGNMNDGYVTGANFTNPFNGRLVISTGNTLVGNAGGPSRMFLVGNITFGAPGTSNGVLEIQSPNYTITNLTNQIAPQLVLTGSGNIGGAVGSLANGSTVTFNNISPVSVVLPGHGLVVSTTNFGRVVVGPDALNNIVPADRLVQPFVGQLIVTSGSTRPYAMNSNLTLAADVAVRLLNTAALFGSPGDVSGYLRAFAPIKLGSNVELGVRNSAHGTLSGTVSQAVFGQNAGALDATDNSSLVRFYNGANGVPANGGVVGTTVKSPDAMTTLRAATVAFSGFSNPFNGTIQTDMGMAVLAPAANTPMRNVYNLFGRIVMGASGSSSGILNASGATLVLAAADLGGMGVNSTVANLVLNNTSSLATAFPGPGLVSVRGLTNGATPTDNGHPAPMAIGANAGGNAILAFGPGALAGVLPSNRLQMNEHNVVTLNAQLAAVGNVIAADDRLGAAFHNVGTAVLGTTIPNPGVRGTLMTSTGTMTLTTASIRFSSGGTLLVGGPDLRYSATGVAPAATSLVPMNAVLNVPDGITVTIATAHRSAFGGTGQLVLQGTNASLVLGGTYAGIPANAIGGNDGVLYGQHIGGGQTIGRIVINGNSATAPYTELRGNLRFGDGSATAGHLAFTNATAQLMVGTNSTLNLAATKSIAIQSNPSGVTPAGAHLAGGVAFAALTNGLIIGPGGATSFAGSPGANAGTTSSVVVFGPDYGRFNHSNNAASANVNRQIGMIDQTYPVLDTRLGAGNLGHTGVIITSTGTIAITNGNFSLLGQLEMGGPVNVESSRTAEFNNVAANSFRKTTGSNGHLRANPDGLAVATQIVLGPDVTGTLDQMTTSSFNGGVLPADLLGRARGTNAPTGLPIDGEVTNTFGATRGTATLNINSSRLTLSGGNLYMYGDLNFTAFGGDINIPASTRLTINGGFAQAAGNPRGVINGANSTSVLAIAPAARLNAANGTFDQTDNTLDANSPQLGARGVAPTVGAGFTGTLLLLSSGFNENLGNTYPLQTHGSTNPVSNLGVSAITVTIATAGVLDMESTRSSIVLRNATARLNLNNTGVNSFMPSLVAAQANGGLRVATTSIVSIGHNVGAVPSAVTNAVVSLGAGFNNSSVPGTLLSSYNMQAGPSYIMNSSLNLGSQMFVATTGSWNFNSGTNKLTLGANNMTVHSPVQNASLDRYFVTDGAGVVGLNGVGNVTFPVGPTSTSYTPINIVNNAVASLFSVGARPRTVTVPSANANSNVVLSSVNAQWNVTQNNNVSSGVAVIVSPQWPSSLQGVGFNSQIARVDRYSGATIAQSSTPSPASPVAGLTNYFTSTLVVTQTAIPGSLVSSPIIVTSQPTPAISSFSPASGFTGSVITIVGSRFTGVTAVTFGGTAASSFTVNANGDTIRATVASGATGNIVVTQAGGTASLGTFTYLGAPPTTPVITSALPAPILAGLGDAVVTITGTGFGSLNVRVLVTGSGLTGSITPTSNSATSIRITVPGQFTRNVGSITLQVVSSDRNPVSTTVPVAVAPATTLTGVTPAASTSGNLAAHTIELTGTSFGPQSVFSLNGVPLTIVGFTNNTNGTSTARVLVPAGVTSGDIVVTNLNNTTGRIPYTVNGLPRPVITSVNPLALLPGSPTTRLTVTGQNFIPGAVVTFNGQPLTTASVSATSIAFDVPASLLTQPDLATIRIINPDNQVIGYRFPISTTASTVVDPNAPMVPVVNGVPTSGSITPATTTATATAFQLTINGSNFRPGLIASLGGVPLTIVSVTDTRIVANVPASANVAGMAQLQLANGTSVLNLPYTITGTGSPISGVPVLGTIRQERNQITIPGSNFAPGATVTFGPNNTPLTVVPGTNQLVATLPSPTPNGSYTVTVTNPGANGGSATGPVVISSVSTERLAATRVYPNPTVDVVNVEANLSRASTVVINVTNTLGQVVMTVRTNAGAGFFSKSINVENLPSGAYNIEVTDGTRRSIEKIIKN